MKRLRHVVGFAVIIGFCLIFTMPSAAKSQSLVISQLQAETVTASHESIELYNTAETAVDVTGWCLYYASAGSQAKGSKISCIGDNAAGSLHLFVPARSTVLFVSTQYTLGVPAMVGDVSFSSAMAGTGGHLRLIDKDGFEVDKIGWGSTALSPEGSATPAHTKTTVLQRLMNGGNYVDTDNNAADFVISSPRISYQTGFLYEVSDVCSNIAGVQSQLPVGYVTSTGNTCVEPPSDVCRNIDGLQVDLPSGFALNELTECVPDVCSNLAGIQSIVPLGFGVDEGECVLIDECINVTGTQATVPLGFASQPDRHCLWVAQPIFISELYINPTGSDTGREFIEVYNPNDFEVDLSYFRLWYGVNLSNEIIMPASTGIPGQGYRLFDNTALRFTLTNTEGRAGMSMGDGLRLGQTDSYQGAPEGMSWALVEGAWQYTDRVTPGSANLMTSDEVGVGLSSSSQKPCAPNQYRNPETNRCRNLTTTSGLTACKNGQYRSEETNRCRSVASDSKTYAACDANEERNPVTNRCRSVLASVSSLAGCKPGQERNPETNRCRNVATMPEAAFGVTSQSQSAPPNYYSWLAIGGLLALATGYGVWEWRREIVTGFKRAWAFVRRR